MKRRKFLKIIGIASVTAVLSPALTFAKTHTKKVLEAIKTGRYPGKIKSINENVIKREGKWLG